MGRATKQPVLPPTRVRVLASRPVQPAGGTRVLTEKAISGWDEVEDWPHLEDWDVEHSPDKAALDTVLEVSPHGRDKVVTAARCCLGFRTRQVE